jgi:DNA-binding beta-propeller fold protein YncE
MPSKAKRPLRLGHRLTTLWILAFVCYGAEGLAQSYRTQVVVSGLSRPTGIEASGSETLFFTQLPTPGISGMQGGRNTVNKVNLASGKIAILTQGEPEPTNLTFSKGVLYWTCKSAGVILQRLSNGAVSLFLGALTQPSGISIDPWNRVYFTQLPTPGVPGSMGGTNTVNVSNGVMTRVLTIGEPEPTDIAVAKDGTAYWTCKSADVILKRTPSGVVSLLLSGLDKPVGIALDHQGKNLYWTEVPTPGVSGSMGGRNKVNELDLETMSTSLVDFGDPEPTDITVATNGNLYWTCSSAGVIVEAERLGGR